MVCSCENRCSCEEHCACCGKCDGVVCHGKKTYTSSLFPICKAILLENSNKITLTSSTTTLSTEKGSSVLNKVKSKKYNSSNDSIVPLTTTSNKSTLNDSKSLISENEQTKLSAQKAPSISRFNSLKRAMLKMRRRFKKLKIRKKDSSALLATEREYYSTEESSVEMVSSEEADFSPGKRIESLNKSYSTENLLQYFSKAENVSFFPSRSDQNIELISRAKSLTLTFNTETGAFEKQDYNLTGIAADDNLISRTQSCLYTKGSSHPLQTCSTPLLFSLNPLCASNNKKEGYTLPENKKWKMINPKNSEKSPDRQFNISYKPAIFKRNFLKSRSISVDDKSITVPLYSGFRDELCSKQLCSYAQPLRSSIDRSKNTEFLNCEIHSQAANSEVISEPLNESPKALISPSRSTFQDKVETPHSFSQKSLHSSQSHQSLRSFLELSLNETIGLDNSDIQDHNTTDATTVNFVSSDVSDNFEIFEIRSSPDSTDSESVSSSEFLPCSYCRFVTCIPPISDSVIPYETLE